MKAQLTQPSVFPRYSRHPKDWLDACWHYGTEGLQRVREIQARLDEQRQVRDQTSPASPNEFADLAAELTRVWDDPQSDARLKKRIVRTLIKEVIVNRDDERNEVALVIHWHGGVHTELRVPCRRRGQATCTAPDIIEAVRSLARICTDRAIAGYLNRNNLQTGRGNRFTQERVTSLRSRHGIDCHNPELRDQAGWLTLTEAAKFIGVSTRTLRIAAEQGKIPGQHPLPNGPWIFVRADLQTDAARQVVEYAHRCNRRHPAVPNPQQRNLDFSGT